MSLTAVESALADTEERELARHFVNVWPTIETILAAFSTATQLPLAVFLRGKQVFASPASAMPTFCREIVQSAEGHRCLKDSVQRAAGSADGDETEQLCHAGMSNGKTVIDTGGLGPLVITYGSRRSGSELADASRRRLLEELAATDRELAARLRRADEAAQESMRIASHDRDLIEAIATALGQLLRATVGFRQLSINMAHELCATMLGIGLLTRSLEREMNVVAEAADEKGVDLAALRKICPEIIDEAQLGLYVVRNFLSHASESQYHKAVAQRLEPVRLGEVILQMVSLHQRYAATKGIEIEAEGIEELPVIQGHSMELRRLLHNVLANAIKYSYKSVPTARRVIKVTTKVPYDPGFQQRRLGIAFENFGLGVSEEESRKVFTPGFRGEQAVREVPIGSGIGLSEVQKVMRAHHGTVKFRSRVVHVDEHDRPTYVTRVELVFPY